MGCSTALLLARRGLRVTLVDAAPRVMHGASRWNEGKIHLGYLYAADPSLATARRLLPGGLAFRRIVEDLLGESIAPAVAVDDEIYLTHRDSVCGAPAMASYLDRVSALVGAHPEVSGALAPDADRPPTPLTRAELDALADPASIVAGVRVAERSVSTAWLADRFEAAVYATPGIDVQLGVRVQGVSPDPRRERFTLDTAAGADGPYDAVVNALWHGRAAVDATMGLPAPVEISHRYRVSLFARLAHPIDLPSVVVGVGPFGDVKRYGPHEAYFSWYTAGLLADGEAIAPPPTPRVMPADASAIGQAILEQLGQVLPSVRAAAAAIASSTLQGGWVYASGSGRLSDPASTLHRRDRVGIVCTGRYLSVDTGKYSLAPWLAVQVAEQLMHSTSRSMAH